jgi:hypothetical protein
MVHGADGRYGTLMYQVWDELIVFDDPETFKRNFTAAPVAPRTLFAAHWCQSEVRNGGFHQFFWNSTGGLAPEAETAFRELGMPLTSDVVRRALGLFGEPFPRDRDARWQQLEELDRSSLERLDEEFYALWDSENGGFISAAESYAAKFESQGTHA